MRIDEIINRIEKSSNFTPATKARLIRLCERIRDCINAIRKFLRRMIAFLRAHVEFAKAMGIAILLAMIVIHIPLIGQLLAMLTLIGGLAWGVVADLKGNLEALFRIVEE